MLVERPKHEVYTTKLTKKTNFKKCFEPNEFSIFSVDLCLTSFFILPKI